MEFQQRLYELRKQSGLSQEGLASLLGVTRQAVQKWESGSSRPDMDNLAALARYFNVSLDYLVTGQERTAPPPAATTIIHNHYSRWHYEYKSSRTLFGLPLIHIRLGERGLCTARGIIAIGNCAVGALSIGGFSFGLVSVGGLSLGLLAFGGVAAGFFSLGGCAFGVYAAGGAAAASKIAIGGAASAPLAIGQTAEGVLTFGLGSDPAAVAAAIRQAAAGVPRVFQELLIFLARHW